jgi:hypothetical protein
VHREELVVALGPDHPIVGLDQLKAHEQRDYPAEHEESEGGDNIAPADLFMVDRRQPAKKTRRAAPRSLEPSGKLVTLELGSVANDVLALPSEPPVLLVDPFTLAFAPGHLIGHIGSNVGHLSVSR